MKVRFLAGEVAKLCKFHGKGGQNLIEIHPAIQRKLKGSTLWSKAFKCRQTEKAVGFGDLALSRWKTRPKNKKRSRH